MTKRIFGVVVSVILLAGLAAPRLEAARVVERIIARVNNEIITMRQYQQEKEKLREQLAEQYSGAELEAHYREQSKDLLRDMIDQSLMVQKAKDLDINVETDVIKRLDDIRQRYHLATIEALQTEVEKQGILWEDFKDQIRRQLLMREVIGREVGSRIILSREDARKYYDAHKDQFKSPGIVHLSQILISTEKHNPAEAKQRADEALAALGVPLDFAGLHFRSATKNLGGLALGQSETLPRCPNIGTG